MSHLTFTILLMLPCAAWSMSPRFNIDLVTKDLIEEEVYKCDVPGVKTLSAAVYPEKSNSPKFDFKNWSFLGLLYKRVKH